MSIDVSAAEIYTKWTVQETSAFFGTSIPCNYEIGGVTVSGSFEYAGTYGNDWISACNIESNSVLSTAAASSYDVLAYRLTNYTYAGSNVGHVSIPVDIYVTGGFRTFWGICSSLETSGSPNPVFSLNSIADYPDNFISGGSAALPSASSPQYYNASTIRFAYQGQSYYACTMRALTYDETDGTISQLNFDGSRFFGTGELWLFIATPYSYGDVSHDSPTTTAPPVTTAPSGTGDINVNVDVDLTETNSILTTIANGISGFFQVIVDALSDLFLPDEDYVKNWADDVKDLLESHFLGTGVNVDPLIDAFEDLATYGATTSIRFPGIDLNIANTNFSIPAKSVDLRPMEDSGIYGYIEIAINIAATLSVFNLVQRKIKAILVGERVVEVEGDDD